MISEGSPLNLMIILNTHMLFYFLISDKYNTHIYDLDMDLYIVSIYWKNTKVAMAKQMNK